MKRTLRAEASRMGILDGYVSQDGKKRTTSDKTRAVLLQAMGDAGERTASGTRPSGTQSPCPSAEEILDGRRVWGITVNLYTMKSRTNWGIGNTGDLEALVRWTASQGGAFVGLNPLHAIRNRGNQISPYGPVSRLFRNPLYIDVTRVPEWRGDEHTESRAKALRAAPHIDYDAVRELVMPALRSLHAVFTATARGARKEAYLAYCHEQGSALDQFAVFCAIEDDLRERMSAVGWWGEWPAPLRDPRSAAVDEFARVHAQEVDFHRWLQFELDRQLAEVASVARASGMPIGLYQDLAIGTSADAADVWAHPSLFVRGVSIGAPPDPYAATGQIWGLLPMHPHRLADAQFEYWRALVRSALRHGGAIRVDHVLGLFRQFWIPDGGAGKDGAYVRYPRDAMLAVLAEEARRANAIVVGEDLGTVPPEVPRTLARWNILSSKVMYFEWSAAKGFRAARSYPAQALATVNTHDHAPLAGYWEGRDISLRESLGTLPPRIAARTRASRVRERAALLALLHREGLLASLDEPPVERLVEAVHSFIRRTPCWLVGLSLDDLAGERENVNVPGVPIERHRSWSRRLGRDLEDLLGDPATVRLLGDERRW